MKTPLTLVALTSLLALPLMAQEKKPAAAAEATANVAKDVTVDEAEKLMKDTAGLQVIDVRTEEEFEHEHIAGAKNINFHGVDFDKEIAALDPKKPILVHCAAGSRSAQAVDKLQSSKFPVIYHMNAGFAGWKKAGKPIEGKPLPTKKILPVTPPTPVAPAK